MNNQIIDERTKDERNEYEILYQIQSMIQTVTESAEINFRYNLLTGVILAKQNKPLSATGRILMKCADCQHTSTTDYNELDGVYIGCQKFMCPLNSFMREKRYELTDKELHTKN